MVGLVKKEYTVMSLDDAVDKQVHAWYGRKVLDGPHTTYTHAANWLNSHPDRERIASDFKDKLEKEGHDGVVYGNEVEGPFGHKCAITFHNEQIHNLHRQEAKEASLHTSSHGYEPGRIYHTEEITDEGEDGKPTGISADKLRWQNKTDQYSYHEIPRSEIDWNGPVTNDDGDKRHVDQMTQHVHDLPPVVINKNNRVWDGDHRMQAWDRAGFTHIPVLKPIQEAKEASLHLATDADKTGVMIALVPPKSVLEQLSVEGGESVDDMHITVAYLGKTHAIDEDDFHNAVEAFANTAPPMHGKITGFGQFNKGVHVALVDIPGIDQFRRHLMTFLSSQGIHVKDEHGVLPHITLAYSDDTMDLEDHNSQHSFELVKVTAAYGGTWTEYPLQGQQDFTKAATRSHLLNPEEGSTNWYHGTPRHFDQFENIHDDDNDASQPDHWTAPDSHWNSRLGQHWTSLKSVAKDFARGTHNYHPKDEEEGTVYTANLGIKHPKHYKSEFDMDREALDDAWEKYPTHDPVNLHDANCKVEGCHADKCRRFQVHGHEWYRRDCPAYWLSGHPDVHHIANDFKQKLQEQGRDGITYGNEIEEPKGHRCAITFDNGQVHNRKSQLESEAAMRTEAKDGWGKTIAPQYAGDGEINEHATEMSRLPTKLQDKIHKNIEAHSPDPENHPFTQDAMVENIKKIFRRGKSENGGESIHQGAKWYNEAHNFADQVHNDHSKDNRYGTTQRHIVGAIAATSPQTDWDENSTVAKHLAKHLHAPDDHPDSKLDLPNAESYHPDLHHGMAFKDIKDPELVAHAFYHQTKHKDLRCETGAPTSSGEMPKIKLGNSAHDNIVKATRILRGEDPHDVLRGHKVRSFFNNMR